MAELLAQADALQAEGKIQETYDLLAEALNVRGKDVEVVWRFARACYQQAEEKEDKKWKEEYITKVAPIALLPTSALLHTRVFFGNRCLRPLVTIFLLFAHINVVHGDHFGRWAVRPRIVGFIHIHKKKRILSCLCSIPLEKHNDANHISMGF